ncbi:fumarylacetoacetate hydrolase family protein [Desulfuribacillus alkaliarsenatis]|uniref:2-hydroxyhepta-2,4-diene-1,7-dioate isomerase n=1 Tax=Desulfuribacillus alkaliarsenatis TaxID=766136 RepID=A0A1E5G691_9FIRM|nr:fumarylacetoacetate hydrolase family protein [Desulfuribacillus alkaliarsenatis]OEF98691.1 hypothetical protein BHF68_03250 [Desulfuribacillus alkaliarsenatis]
MKFVRFQLKNKVMNGIIEDDLIREIDGTFYDDYSLTNDYYKISEVKLLSPVQPSKIVAIGVNYRDHGEEMNIKPPSEPIVFLKPPSAIIGQEDDIIHPSMANRVDYEGELAIVIGAQAKDITKERADEYILGYTICNDVTARDLQAKDNQWTRAKGFDTFAPIGPWIVNDLGYNNLHIETRLNGKVVQQANTNQMIFKVDELVEYISQIMTLLPGDIIITGTSSGIGPMQKGDIVEIEVEGIGILKNYNR